MPQQYSNLLEKSLLFAAISQISLPPTELVSYCLNQIWGTRCIGAIQLSIDAARLHFDSKLSLPASMRRVVQRASHILTQPTFPATLHALGGGKLNTTEDQDEAAEPPAKVKSVAATILGEFFDALEKKEGFGEITPRLRKVVLEDGVFTESSIRTALFPDAS
jgi:hypothetical protein